MTELRLAELTGVVSLATDLAEGRASGRGLRAAVMAVRIANLMNLDPIDRQEAFYVALLRDLGTTARARELRQIAEDDVAAQQRAGDLDLGRPRGAMARIASNAAEGRRVGRTTAAVRGLVLGPRVLERAHQAGAESAAALARRLGLRPGVGLALFHVHERWDGRGYPSGVGRDAGPVTARIASLAHELAAPGDDSATDRLEPLKKRAGRIHDPILVDLVDRRADIVIGDRQTLGWKDMLAAEPRPQHTIPNTHLDTSVRAVGDFADLKTPFLTGHSAAVGDLAAAAGKHMELARRDVRDLRHAGYLHDLGRVAISSGVWERPRGLDAGAWERVRTHAQHSERLLAQSESLAHLGAIAGRHHERLDGSGYHRAAGDADQPLLARILAASDAYQAMSEDRPHRGRLVHDAIAKVLRREVQDGLHDRDSVRAVLAVAKQRRTPPVKRTYPAGLTHREAMVLRLAAVGCSDRQIADRLHIDEGTAASHMQNIGMKLGVTSRAAATVAAAEHGIVDRTRVPFRDPDGPPRPRYQR